MYASVQPHTSQKGADVHDAVHALQLLLAQVETTSSAVDCHQASTLQGGPL
jgi:hypothetical protein